MSYCILVADTNVHLVHMLVSFLRSKGHGVVGVHSAPEAARCLRDVAVDLMVLGMPICRLEDREVCRILGTQTRLKQIPLLLLSYVSGPCALDCILRDGLKVKAEDCLKKPIAIAELEKRLAARLQGGRRPIPVIYEHKLKIGPPLVIDPYTFEVYGGREHKLLTPTEFALLRYLMEHRGEVISYQRLLQDVWEYPPDSGSPEVVRWHIKNLRTKLNLAAGCPIPIIRTVPWHGYTIPREAPEQPFLPHREFEFPHYLLPSD